MSSVFFSVQYQLFFSIPELAIPFFTSIIGIFQWARIPETGISSSEDGDLPMTRGSLCHTHPVPQVLFLDVDGVLHPVQVAHGKPGGCPWPWGDPKWWVYVMENPTKNG